MSIDGVNITKTLEKAKKMIAEDKQSSDSLKSMFELLIVIIGLLLQRLGVNSKNSSKPPSQDPNRKRGSTQKGKSKRKPGAQKGHKGSTLELVDNPDETIKIDIDKRSLPQGEYTEQQRERRQIVDVIIRKHVTEYQSQVLVNQNTGERFVASFPEDVKVPAQYGATVKSMATYLSQWQLLPYERIAELFNDQAEIPISPGTLFNINSDAFMRLKEFESIAKQKLIASLVAHADETGINVNGKKIWLHSVSNELWTLYAPHAKRGKDATDEIGILPFFHGTLIHDCWGLYFQYPCSHALCNAHLLRELTAVWENDKHQWAQKAEKLLRNTNALVLASGGLLDHAQMVKISRKYDLIMKQGQKECPVPDPPSKKKRGRQAKTKARNLLERLMDHKDAVLRFAQDPLVAFTNNRAENDIRMTKVQQKISGCFRSMEGAKIFCRIRSYLSTCRKHKMSATCALQLLFEGKMPDFIKES